MTPMERTEHQFGPFWEKDFRAISGGPFFSRPLWFTAEILGVVRFRVCCVFGCSLFSSDLVPILREEGTTISTFLEEPLGAVLEAMLIDSVSHEGGFCDKGGLVAMIS